MNTELEKIRYYWERLETKPTAYALSISLAEAVSDLLDAQARNDDDMAAEHQGEIWALNYMLLLASGYKATPEELTESAMFWIRKGERA